MSNFYNDNSFPNYKLGVSSGQTNFEQPQNSWGSIGSGPTPGFTFGWTGPVRPINPSYGIGGYERGWENIEPSSPSFSSSPCYNTNKEGTRESGENMSFVGMRICKDGIVAWGDSKGTIQDEFGNMYLDKNREDIRKVFKNKKEKYLIATFGNNTLPSDWVNKVEHMEDWLTHNVNKCENPYILLDDFSNYIWHVLENKMEYNFFICHKDKRGYYIQEATVMSNGIFLNRKIYGGGNYLINNIQVYASSYNSQSFFSELSCSEFIEKFNNWLLSEIEVNNKNCIYNPVGGPIRFETLLFEECEREKK